MIIKGKVHPLGKNVKFDGSRMSAKLHPELPGA
jgi:hypothetical protein